MQRTRWEYIDDTNGREGVFVKTSEKNWKNLDAHNYSFYFLEISRTSDSIELFDKSRDMYVRLDGCRLLWKLADNLKWNYHPTSKGRWCTQSTTSLSSHRIGKVSVVYLVPYDAEYFEEYKTTITNAIKHLQWWYWVKMKNGKTFELNDPVIQVLHAPHAASWYSTNPSGKYREWFWNNVLADGFLLTGAGFNDPENVWIFYIDAENADGQYGGAGTSSVAVLPQHDLQGLIGKTNEPILRWVGGLGHELGHAFGLDHPPGCDENQSKPEAQSLMYLGYSQYPDTFLLPVHTNILNQSQFFTYKELRQPQYEFL